MPHFGFDLDNTLIDYSESCKEYSRMFGLPYVNSIGELRKILKPLDRESEEWTRAQSWIYGAGLQFARFNDGSLNLIQNLLNASWECTIHSHKTEFGPVKFGAVPFRKLMRSWLESSALANLMAIEKSVFFYSSIEDKVSGILRSKVTHFVDDLPKVFLTNGFPQSITCFLYKSEDARLNWVSKINEFKEIQIV